MPCPGPFDFGGGSHPYGGGASMAMMQHYAQAGSLGPGPVVVIAVAGVYRTGKSCFLNRIAGEGGAARGRWSRRRSSAGRCRPCAASPAPFRGNSRAG